MSKLPPTMMALAGACLAMSASGCGPQAVPTKGIVTFNGAPLAKATVIYAAEEPGGKNASGYTDDNGFFELTSYSFNDGALPGAYKVIVTPFEPTAVVPVRKQPDDPKQINPNELRKQRIPPKYQKQDETPLRRRVPENGVANIELITEP